jgi:ABC-type transport system involved in cytochrome bd biosynthesis fused ATPase/permease subunit
VIHKNPRIMDNDSIVEMGNHNELLKKEGVYKNLYDTQFRAQDNFNEEVKNHEQNN